MSESSIMIVRDDGAELLLGDGLHWHLPQGGVEGFARLSHNLSTSANVLTDGSMLISKRIEETDRTITAHYFGSSDKERARAEAIAFFNPKHSFEAHVTTMGRTRWCEGEQYAFECPYMHGNQRVEFTWTLLCLDPYLRDEDGNTRSLGDSAPMFGFPYVCHPRLPMPDGKKHPPGAPASVTLYDGKNTLYNGGDVPTAFRIVCKAKGTVENPTFTKDGRFVRVVTTLSDGDELNIDFTAAPPTVEINGANAIQKCSRDSSFTGMQMDVGASVFNYSCDNAENRVYMDVRVLFYERYLGV